MAVSLAAIGCRDGREVNPLPSSFLAHGYLIGTPGGIRSDGHVQSVEIYTFGSPATLIAPQVRSLLGSGWDEQQDGTTTVFQRHSPASNLLSEEVDIVPGRMNPNGEVQNGASTTACSVVWEVVGKSVN